MWDFHVQVAQVWHEPTVVLTGFLVTIAILIVDMERTNLDSAIVQR